MQPCNVDLNSPAGVKTPRPPTSPYNINGGLGGLETFPLCWQKDFALIVIAFSILFVSKGGYCREYFDGETGTVYLRARYYDPRTGRFGTEDPIRDGLNWYTYCANNPLIFYDPFGLIPVVVSDFIKEFDYEYSFDSKKDSYTIKINGNILKYDSSGKNKHKMDIWLENGSITAEDYDLAYFFRVDGWVKYFPGFAWRNDETAFTIDTHKYFENRQFCWDFAEEIMKMKGEKNWLSSRYYYNGMSSMDIVAECYAHAMMLDITDFTKEYLGRGGAWNNSARRIDIDADDPRTLRFLLIWVTLNKDGLFNNSLIFN